jgi:hypothetical protein
MRCLHCNKKLSLLKLAKGDSFCSHEHFDAYQLKLSRDAIERLMSVPGDETPKAPLVLNKVDDNQIEEAPADNDNAHQEKAALARLTAYAPPPLPEAAVASQSPPYAPFAGSALPPCSLNPAPSTASGPEASPEVGPARELSFPVHEVDETVCVLHLYLRLGLGGTEPKNWTSDRPLIVTPEYFRLDISQPPLGLSPEFPEIDYADPVVEELPFLEAGHSVEPETQTTPGEGPEPDMAQIAENHAPAELITPIEATAPVDADPIAEAMPFAEAVPVVNPVMYPEHTPTEVSPPSVPLLIEDLGPAELVAPIEAIRAVAAEPLADTLVLVGSAPSITPVLPAAPASLAPIEPAEPRIPFLTAPSFRARSGTPILLHSAASARPNSSNLNPALDNGSLQRLDSCRAIPNFTSFARPPAIRLHNSTASCVGSASELDLQPGSVLPNAKKQLCGDAWRPTNRRILIAQAALEATWASMGPLDFDLPKPASLLSRPDPSRLRKVDPQQLLAGTPLDVVSLFLGVLEIRPHGHEPSFVDLPAHATQSISRAIFSPAPDPEPLEYAWQPQTTHFSLPDPIVDGPTEPLLPLASLQYAPACIKVDCIEKTELPAPYVASALYRQSAWPESDSASAPLGSEPSLVFIGTRTLPQAADMPAGRLQTGSGAPTLSWEPCLQIAQAPRDTRFLPVRNGTVLPRAKTWPLLEAVPR